MGAVLHPTPKDALAWLSRHGCGNLGAYLGRRAAVRVKSLLAAGQAAASREVRPVATGECR